MMEGFYIVEGMYNKREILFISFSLSTGEEKLTLKTLKAWSLAPFVDETQENI